MTALVGLAVPAQSALSDPSPSVAAAPGAVWTATDDLLPAARNGLRRLVNPGEYAAYELDLPALSRRLERAPSESATDADPVRISIPAPSGELIDFEVVESPVMEAGLAAARPDISTFAGRSVSGPPASIRLDTTPMGFHASVRGGSGSWYIDPAYIGADQGPGATYLSYDGKALPAPEKPLIEPEAIVAGDEGLPVKKNAEQRVLEAQGDPVVARTYRIAFATDPTYSQYFAPEATTAAEYNTIVTAQKATMMNRVNQIYGDDTSLRMLLVDETDKTNFNTEADAYNPGGACGATACYVATDVANGCSGTLLTRNKNVLGQVIGAADYDVGHIGLGLNGGGLASLGVVGLANKAQGCTGLPIPDGDFYAVDYVAHEIGHQMAGNHTFDGVTGSCSATNRNARNSVEPGSGSSVMAYAGICQTDNLQPHTDPYFSQRSQTEIGTHITTARGNLNEVQSVSLVGFGDTDSFTLDFGAGRVTAPVTNGTNYTTAGIKSAVEAVLGGTVNVGTYFGSTAFDTAGFQMTFTGTNAGADVTNPVLNVVSAPGSFSAAVNDIVKGGAPTNGGFAIDEVDPDGGPATNRVPLVTAPADKTIPTRTPFELTGSAVDPEGRSMIYLWEQNDRGEEGLGSSLLSNSRVSGPLFRVFGAYADVSDADSYLYSSPGQNSAGTSPTRTFPDLEQVIAGSTNAATGTCPAPSSAPGTDGLPDGPALECFSELLPTSSYLGFDLDNTLNFRLTARDLGTKGYDGGTAFDDTSLTVDPTAGPFLVSSQSTPTTVAGGSAGTVTWAVAGTDSAAMAPNVSILFSTDGGRTYPITLLESTPNDGTQAVTWPDVATTQGRIKVAAVDNYFFDLSNADLTVTSTAAPTPTPTATPTPTPTPTPTATPTPSPSPSPSPTVTPSPSPTPTPDVTAPDTTITSGPGAGRFVLDRSFTFGYESSEEGSTFDCSLGRRSGECPDTGSVTVRGLGSGTYLFSIAATDAAGNSDTTPATRRFSVPVNDRQLTNVKKVWERKKLRDSYRGRYTEARSKGATLRYRVSDVTSMALIHREGKRFGKVDVYLGRTLLRTINTRASSVQPRQLSAIAQFDSPRSGVLRIKTRNGKLVQIEGVGIRTSGVVSRGAGRPVPSRFDTL